MKIDLKDRKILYELDKDSRQSHASIGKKVKLSKEVVNYRIKNMINKGIIKNFFAILDIDKLGYLSFRIFLKFQNTTTKKEKEIITSLKKHPNVGWIVSAKGNWDANFVVWEKDIYGFNKFWKNFIEKYKNNINKSWISIITKLYHYRRAYLLDKKEDSSELVVMGGEKRTKVDETDMEILKILAPNARMTSLEIAEKIKVTEKIVRDRIKKLVREKVILGYRVLLDLNLLDYKYYKLHISLQKMDKENLRKLLSYAHHNPNIIYLTETIGGADFELDINAKNSKELHEIIKNIRNKFPNLIRGIEFLQYDEEYKLIYLPVK